MRWSILPALLFVAIAIAEEKLLYCNNFDSSSSISTWVAEGPLNATISNSTLELRGARKPDDYFVYWLPEVFPDRIRITWDFSPIEEPGLAMLFFGATSVTGGSIFDPELKKRNGSYPQYHSSDIKVLHVAYFRRRWPEERVFHVANLRKSPGFHLVSQGADPLPDVGDVKGAYYKVEVIKDGKNVKFSINGLLVFEFNDAEGETGPMVKGGRIALRQMQPLVARYRNLEVWSL
ncbi:hypothetical protein FKW77_008887 [Venturia effusa]|uniref:Cytochrome oxidase subunit II transmembrane region profile domain-containing protein n=1 Tax=Venturia effusa TaxID=50376 RepID=A0A517L642_9PEZI|nr:hypothetical protein FKW77_008887 [Venturia effusa]